MSTPQVPILVLELHVAVCHGHFLFESSYVSWLLWNEQAPDSFKAVQLVQ